jgi:hypothetical protein
MHKHSLILDPLGIPSIQIGRDPLSGPDSEVRIIPRRPRLRTSESKDTSNLLI